MNKNSNLFKEVIQKLERKTRREYAFLAAGGIIITILASVAVLFIYSVIESMFHFSSSVRTFLFFFFILITLSSAAFLFILPLSKFYNLFRKTDYFKAAADVGRFYPILKDDLLNAMQLVSVDNNIFYSSALIDAAFKKVYEKSRDIHFEETVSFLNIKKLSAYGAGSVLIMFLLLFFVPGLQAAAGRLYYFEKEFKAPPEFTLTVYPGNAQITKGENVLIKVIAQGNIPKELNLAIKSAEQTDYEIEKLSSDSAGVFEYTINSIRSSLKYFASAGEIKSEEYSVEVIDKPLVKTFDVIVRPPSYCGLPETAQKDNGNLSALMGSTVDFRVYSNKELQASTIQFDDSSEVILKVQYSSATGGFQIKGDKNYQILVTDISGNYNESPITYSIKAQYDSYPSIEMTEPAKDVNLSNDNRVPLGLKISDDFGFSKLILYHRLSASRYESPSETFHALEIPIDKKSNEAEVNYVWNLSSMSLGTDDMISYYLEISDNDRVSGPKSSRTSVYNVRVPSLEELLAFADKKHNEVAQDLKETLKEAEELKKDLEKISNELKQDKKELTWEEKEKIQSALDKFEKLQEKVKESSKEMNELNHDMQKNDLLSQETLEKYMELQKLFEELSGEEFQKAMEQMRDQLQKMDRKTAQDALENMKINEENFKKSIERTLNLLKRVKIEQKVDDLVKRAEEVNKNLEELMKENENNQTNQKKQENTSSQLKKMEEEMNKLENDMEGLEDMPKEDLEKISEEFEKQRNDEMSKQAQQDMQQNKMNEANQKQSQLSNNMKNFSKQMQQLQQQIQQQNQMQTFTDMMKLLENLITLSKQQEELKQETQNSQDMTSMNKNAERQGNIQKNLDNILKQLSEMSQKTFAITPEMGKALGDAKREMMKSLQGMQSRNGNMSSNSQGEAMKSLNEAATLMQNSMEMMMQGGGQGGMMSLMQQLGQMAQQQMGLNNLTQKLQQGNQGQLSQEQMAELQRIQQQQDLIKKSLEELNIEAKRTGESKKIPANLENIVKEMEEVISDMDSRKLDDNLVQKQEKILSRLLDAQRSMNERDFEKQRESFTGENIVRQSPSELNLKPDKESERLKDELNKAVNEGYRKDYENLIRKYFEALQKEKGKQTPPGN